MNVECEFLALFFCNTHLIYVVDVKNDCQPHEYIDLHRHRPIQITACGLAWWTDTTSMPPSRRSQHAALQDGLDRTPRPARHDPARRAGEEPAVLDEATAIAVAAAVDVDVGREPTPRASHRSRQPTQR